MAREISNEQRLHLYMEIVFHYKKEEDKENEHEFGTKEILVPKELNNSDKEFDYLYLIGINYADKKEYGKTILRRRKK